MLDYVTEAAIALVIAGGSWALHILRQKESRLLAVEQRVHKLRSRAEKHEAVTEVKLGSIKKDLEEIKDTLNVLLDKHLK